VRIGDVAEMLGQGWQRLVAHPWWSRFGVGLSDWTGRRFTSTGPGTSLGLGH
jgi:hypothetical protein